MRPAALSGLRTTSCFSDAGPWTARASSRHGAAGARLRGNRAQQSRARRDSTDKLGFQADRHRRQRLGDRAVLLGVVGDGAELLLVDAGDLRLELEADLRQRRAAFQ